jgi:alpha-tubulin suppressor-like RCC1 family protein
VLADGGVTCWGETLDASAAPQVDAEPRAVPGIDDAVEVAAGAGFSCARSQGGAVVCWGDNASGQLGDGTTEARATPAPVRDLELSLQISAGGGERDGQLVGHACSLTRGFFVQCWGRNGEGQLGIGEAPDRPLPELVMGELGEEDDEPLLPDVTTMGAGGFFSCSIDHDGPVLCWGDDSRGQRGTRETPFGRVSGVDLFRD